ncbi:retrovirus-related pol polyprotein from transposon TNT 1-94 [Tanacetum coccineum]
MRCPQHYLIDMQEVILFYKGFEVPTRQILDSKGAIPTMTAANARELALVLADRTMKHPKGITENILVEIDFAVVENMDSYRDEGMGDIIIGRPFCKEACVKTIQKAKLVPKTVEKQVLTKLVTLQTLPQKKNVNASCDSCDVMYVSCAKSCLINCHDKCVAKYVNSVKHKARRALCTSPLAVKTRFVDASPIAPRASLVVITHVNAKDKASSSRSKSLEFLKVSTPNMAALSPVYLMFKASSTKSWLWHRLLSHLNFATINQLAKQDMVVGLPKFKYEKDHLCSACKQGKSKRALLKPKPVTSIDARLQLLPMDLCDPMRVESINGKLYILVIVDDYSCYTWVYFLRSNDEASEMFKKFITRIQVSLRAIVCYVRTDNGTDFKNEILTSFYEKLDITQQKSIARIPQRNGVVERRNRTLDIIVDGDLQEEAAPAGEQSGPPAPKTAKQLTAKRNQERVKSILLLAIPDEYLLKFHNVPDAKSLSSAIKSSQLEVHAAPVSKEDINQKFLRSLPPSWSQIALIMRNKPDIDQTDIDDLYNNLRVYEDKMKSTNEVSTASGNFGVNTAGGTNSPSQIDQDDLEELDIRWQLSDTTVTGKGHFAKECKLGRNQGKRSYGDISRRNETINEPSSQALVAQDGLGGYDWSNDFDEPVNYALMAISSSSSSSSSDNEVQNYSKQCLESFKTLQKNFDSEREKHSRARLEIQGYELALESLESRILGHEKNELAWGEKYEFQNYELKCREIKINNLKMELEKVVKERDELKVKIEKWEESSKGLNKLLNSQMSAKDKNGLGYGTQLDEMSNKSETDSEISMSVFEVRSSDEEITPANDRFQKLISQLEVHAAPVSKEDINQKFLRSLPPSWSQIALIMRNKPDIDQTDIDDLYNNLRVYEDEMKRSSSSTSNSQNLAFLSSENTSSTNEVSTASGNFGVNTAGGTNSSSQVSSTPGADEVVCSFFAQQTTSPPLDNEDLQQIDQDDLEELDIRWQVAMLTVRVQRFIQKTGRNLDFKGKQPVTFDKSKVECYNCHKKGHFAKECKSGRNQGKRSYGDNGSTGGSRWSRRL